MEVQNADNDNTYEINYDTCDIDKNDDNISLRSGIS